MFLRTRFAPTPSGYLHAGNGVSFILTWVLARLHGAKIWLRIDDLDRGRFRITYLEDIFRTLEWLGLDYDEGPDSVGDFNLNWSQHHRLDQYRKALNHLIDLGGVYACSCTRSILLAKSNGHIYPGYCLGKQLSLSGSGTSWRIHVPNATLENGNTLTGPIPLNIHQLIGDFVIRQKNKMPSYQVASLVDDALYEVDLIIRGADLLPSTGAQLFLARQLEMNHFMNTTFWHHDLILSEKGDKLSKSAGSASLKSWRANGLNKASLYNKAGELMGLKGDFQTLVALLEATKDANLNLKSP